ncbi:MAG: hypothetical protein EOP55_09960 [Sphingobacteriales bacterium]|nr:MAG: hypothetical protein EOP55_09960 [Sphingobacteriales bacterium]
MRNFITIFTIFFSVLVNAQDYPRNKPQLLLNKEVKITPLNSNTIKYYGGYDGFYSDEFLREIYKKNARLVTDPDAFTNRTFKVTGVEPISTGDRFKVKLEDISSGKVIYFKYNPISSSGYYFEIKGGLDLPEDFYCDLIKEVSRENEPQRFIYMERPVFVLLKTEIDGVETYLLELELSTDENEDGKGMVIVLENNKKIEKPNLDVKKQIKSETPHYTAYIALTSQEIDLLKSNNILSYNIYKFNASMPQEYSENIRGALNCMTRKKK